MTEEEIRELSNEALVEDLVELCKAGRPLVGGPAAPLVHALKQQTIRRIRAEILTRMVE